MDDRNYRDVFWCNISEKSVNRKTIKAKDLKLGDVFFYNGYEYTVKYISEARVLGSSGVMGSKTDLHKETNVEVRE